MAESFFGALKNELVYRTIFATQAKARAAVAEYIEVFYNRIRLPSGLGYRTGHQPKPPPTIKPPAKPPETFIVTVRNRVTSSDQHRGNAGQTSSPSTPTTRHQHQHRPQHSPAEPVHGSRLSPNLAIQVKAPRFPDAPG